MNWLDSLLTFQKLAKNQSFAETGRELNVNTSVVTKRIQWLEYQLKSTLFVRTTRKVTVTEAGEFLLQRITPLLEEWRDVKTQVLDLQKQPSGIITISAPPSLNSLPIFVEGFNEFTERYPKLSVVVQAKAHAINLLNSDVDILIGTEKYLLDPQDVVGVKLTVMKYQCFASPSYLKKHGTPKKIEDLHQHNCLIYNQHPWDFNGESHHFKGNLASDSGDFIRMACKLGIGIMYAPLLILKKEAERGELVPLLNKEVGRKTDLMLYYLKREYKPRKIQLFIDFLLKYFGKA